MTEARWKKMEEAFCAWRDAGARGAFMFEFEEEFDDPFTFSEEKRRAFLHRFHATYAGFVMKCKPGGFFDLDSVTIEKAVHTGPFVDRVWKMRTFKSKEEELEMLRAFREKWDRKWKEDDERRRGGFDKFSKIAGAIAKGMEEDVRDE